MTIAATSGSPVLDTATASLSPQSAAPAQTPAPEATEPKVEATPEPKSQSQGKVVAMPTQAVAKIRAEGREQGKRQAMKELDAEAVELGYSSYAEMKAAAAQARIKTITPKPAAANPEPAPQQQADSQQLETPMTKKGRAELEAALEKTRESNRRAAAEERRRKAAERRVADLEVESELKIAAIRAGVIDPEYAVHYARTALKSKTPEELRNFDENSFFVELRKTKPYLFGSVEMPATTSSDVVPPQQRPGQQVQQQDNSGTPDVRKMSRDEYAAYMKKHGRTIPGSF